MWLNIGNFEMSTLNGLLCDIVAMAYSCKMLLIPGIDACNLFINGFSMTGNIRMLRSCDSVYKLVLILNAGFTSCARASQWLRVYTPVG